MQREAKIPLHWKTPRTALSYVEVYGPRLIATVWSGLVGSGLVRRSRLLTNIQLL